MEKFIGYRCSVCYAEYQHSEVTYTCPQDGGNLDVVLDYEHIQQHWMDKLIDEREGSLWRYLPLLPVSDPGTQRTPLKAAGWTPVFSPPALSTELGLKNLWIKDESRNPTASFKDRASAIVVTRAKEIGAEVVVTASTGNAGAALAGMAAAVGQKSVIFAPRSAPSAKVAQLLIYGAEVILVDDNYDAAFDLSVKAAEEFGWYCRNTGYNPFTAEGKKTGAFEIWEFCEERKINVSTLNIFVSVGDGNIISGIHKGFKDLYVLGLIEQTPRIFGIQSDGSAAIANAFNSGREEIFPVAASTRADSISVDNPRDGLRALRAATQTGGAYITVPDEEIIEAIAKLGKVGIFAEPAGAASYAGLIKAVNEGVIGTNDPAFVINTGSGLKDVNAAMMAVGEAPIIEPSMAAVRKILRDR
ncbi:MAG: threonine synthase [Anaerolineae bacterium]|nr:threonine synthase [Anaerolineae bacterium]